MEELHIEGFCKMLDEAEKDEIDATKMYRHMAFGRSPMVALNLEATAEDEEKHLLVVRAIKRQVC